MIPLRTLLAAACVAVIAAVAAVPGAGATSNLWNDAVEYLAIGNAWVNGSGFVDPIRWTSYLQVGPPFPAILLRAPLPAAVLALPLWLGYGVDAARIFHAVLASLTVGAVVLVGRRMMGLAASMACALAIGLMPSWLHLVGMPMSDLPAIGVMLVVLALGSRAADSVPWAAACAFATVLGWATRPTLIVLGPAILLAQVWPQGVPAARRSRSLLAYVALTAAGFVAFRLLVVSATGHAPYAGYGFMSEMLSLADPLSYGKQYVGPLRFVATHGWDVALAIVGNVRRLLDALFVLPLFSRVGWIAAPGAVYCLVAGAPEANRARMRRLVASSALMSAALALASYAALDVYRYPLPFVVCGALCGFAALDDLLDAMAHRWSHVVRLPRRAHELVRTLPLLAVLLLSLPLLGRLLAGGLWRLSPRTEPPNIAVMRDVCRSIAPGKLVAATDPWVLHAWCGNPALQLPGDLVARVDLQQRFLREERPAYVVTFDTNRGRRWIPKSPLLRRIASVGRTEVYKVVSPGTSAADGWVAPPPLMCAGYDDACRLSLGR